MSDRILELDELTALFGYSSERAVKTAIQRDTFPVPTYRIGGPRGRIVADTTVVNAYFDAKRDEGLAKLKEQA